MVGGGRGRCCRSGRPPPEPSTNGGARASTPAAYRRRPLERDLHEEALDATASVASVASAPPRSAKLFQYTVPAVSLPRQRSAMIPIITDPIEVQNLSIYNQGPWLAKNPLQRRPHQEHDQKGIYCRDR